MNQNREPIAIDTESHINPPGLRYSMWWGLLLQLLIRPSRRHAGFAYQAAESSGSRHSPPWKRG